MSLVLIAKILTGVDLDAAASAAQGLCRLSPVWVASRWSAW